MVAAGTKKISKGIISFVVSLAMFMEALDTTIINTAIPSMASSLQVSPIDLKIALISYLLSLAIFIPISGWLADKWGIKRVFVTALIIFLLSSVFCGFSNHLVELVLARVGQGFGGALMVPVARLIILRTFERHELIGAMNKIIMVSAIGVMLGPLFGGLITHYFSWQWIFWVNIPVGLLALLLSWQFLVNEAPRFVFPFDLKGFLIFGAGLSSLTFGLSALSETIIASWLALSLILSAFMLLTFYVIHSRQQLHPLVNMQLFHYRTFQVSIWANLFARLGFGGIPFLLPLFLQISLGYSAQLAGLLLAPIAVGMILVKFFSLKLMHLFGYKKILIINTFLVSLTLISFTIVKQTTPIYVIALLTFLFGLVISQQYSAMNSLAYAQIPPEQMSSASSITSTVQQLAQSFGVAASALLLHYLAFGQQVMFSVVSFHRVFWVLGGVTLVSILLFIRLTSKDGAQMLNTA